MRKEDIKKILVVSNTHWDREFRRSFELTRRDLLDMMDITMDIIENDPDYHSFTLDGHTILLEDYLEMRPGKQEKIKKLLQEGRLIAGPYYTLAEEFSIGQEALVRNLLFGRKLLKQFGVKQGSVAYTPSSWGQTGQLPQILLDFGLDKMMFYRGVSHHESNAEYIWSAPDGSTVLASRFAIYARYNWYYLVHRYVNRDTVFDKTYHWGRHDEIPLRFADGTAGQDPSFKLIDPQVTCNKNNIKTALESMLDMEADHFTTPVFLAMNGHDISVAHPLETKVIKEANGIFNNIDIKHASLEDFWNEAIPYLKKNNVPVLEGERRAYLKEGMWTYLFPGTISARTYLKQKDFESTSLLVNEAEPLATMCKLLGGEYPEDYLNRAWKFLLSNHTHDANGGCAPDAVCQDMEYRYRKVQDICQIVCTDGISHVVKNLSANDLSSNAMLLVVFNSLPIKRDVISKINVHLPSDFKDDYLKITDNNGQDQEIQPLWNEGSSIFVDSIWEVPTILNTRNYEFYACLKDIPSLGYKVFYIEGTKAFPGNKETLVRGTNAMENNYLRVKINPNGTVDLLHKQSGISYKGLNYLTDEGEAGNAWQHIRLNDDRVYCTKGVSAKICIVEVGSLSSTIRAEYDFEIPAEYNNAKSRSERMVKIPVKVFYTIEKDCPWLKIRVELNNFAKDHWLRANFTTGLNTEKSWSDTHFDVVARDIHVPDSTGWVEEAMGTQPLQAFVSLSDNKSGISILSKGLFEYEVFEKQQNTIALTLLRACRIKLKVSEEKTTELEDDGIQCPGIQVFEYAIYPHQGDWKENKVHQKSKEYITSPRIVQAGRGKGSLPFEYSLLTMDNPNVMISSIKESEDKKGVVLRLFNPTEEVQTVEIEFKERIKELFDCGMAEEQDRELPAEDHVVNFQMGKKKIKTLKFMFDRV